MITNHVDCHTSSPAQGKVFPTGSNACFCACVFDNTELRFISPTGKTDITIKAAMKALVNLLVLVLVLTPILMIAKELNLVKVNGVSCMSFNNKREMSELDKALLKLGGLPPLKGEYFLSRMPSQEGNSQKERDQLQKVVSSTQWSGYFKSTGEPILRVSEEFLQLPEEVQKVSTFLSNEVPEEIQEHLESGSDQTTLDSGTFCSSSGLYLNEEGLHFSCTFVWYPPGQDADLSTSHCLSGKSTINLSSLQQDMSYVVARGHGFWINDPRISDTHPSVGG